MSRDRLERRAERLRRRAGSVRETAKVARRLIQIERFGEAERILEIGLVARGADRRLLEPYALAAHNNGRHAEAKKRWRAQLAVDPGSATALTGVASNARQLFQLDEAQSAISRALSLHPDDPSVVSEAALIAGHRHAHEEAVRLWRRLVDRRDAPPLWRQCHVWNLIMLGRLEEAEVELVESFRLHPDYSGHLLNRAILAKAREDWDGAIAILQSYRARRPDDAGGADLLGQAMEAGRFAEIEAPSSGRRTPVGVGRQEDEARRELLLGFESLGDDCEFGLVQRRFGAEPIGLLRWNTVSLPNLIAGLAARFEGLGAAENTTLGVFGLDEYRVRDQRFGLSMHTFMHKHQIEATILFPKMCRRLAYLREKFIEDLRCAEKIFVYKSAGFGIEGIRSLHRALREIGPVRLLCVVPSTADSPGIPAGRAGRVFPLGADLAIGFIGCLGNSSGVWDIAFDDWMAVCEAARDERVWRGGIGA